MTSDEPFYSGYLLVPGTGKILLKKSWQHKYCLLFKASKFGVQRLEIFEHHSDITKQNPIKIVSLQDCIKIMSTTTTSFTITTKQGVFEFGVPASGSLNEWLMSLQILAFPDDNSKQLSIEEQNDVYCPSGEGIFNVKLLPSTASIRCNLEPKPYLLVLMSNGAELRSCRDNKLLFTWPYCFIRRYGCKDGKFVFEAGRKCESGEGTFHFEHSDQQEVFRSFSSKIKSLKKRLLNETFPTLLDTDTSIGSIDGRLKNSLSSRSNSSQRINTTISSAASKPSGEQPVKPPRRNLHLNKHSNFLQIDDSSYKYEEIEPRSEAWKTLGINEVSHQEVDASDEDYMSWGHANSFAEAPKAHNSVIQAPAIITQSVNAGAYDKLDFFGPTTSESNSSTYNQLKMGQSDHFPVFQSFNDYDEVEVKNDNEGRYEYTTVESVGEKLSVVNLNKGSSKEALKHEIHNNEPYAIISKPSYV